MASGFSFDVGTHGKVSGASYRAADPIARATLVLAHGAGAPRTHPFMTSMAARIAKKGVDVVTFNFLYAEAEILDSWQLVEWRDLFTPDCRYIVPNLALPADAPMEGVLHLIVDDGHHLTERVKRLCKKTAHAEFPRSRTRRLITNVRVTSRSETELKATANFVTYRTSHQVTDTYFGQHQYIFVEQEGKLRIQEKRTVLDIGSLRPQGRLSIIV